MNSKQTVIAPLIALICWHVVGCGGSTEKPYSRAAVTGSVFLDNEPLQEGLVRFVPVEGTPGPKVSVTVTEGEFNIDEAHGPVVGTHRVEIASTDDGGYAMDDEQALQRLKEQNVQKIEVVQVPSIYNTHSNLKETVTAEGPNVYTFQLESPKR